MSGVTIAKKIWAVILILSFVFPLGEIYAQGLNGNTSAGGEKTAVIEIPLMRVIDFKTPQGEEEFNTSYEEISASLVPSASTQGYSEDQLVWDSATLENIIKRSASMYEKYRGKPVSIASTMPCRGEQDPSVAGAEYCSLDGFSPPLYKSLLIDERNARMIRMGTVRNYNEFLSLFESVAHYYKWLKELEQKGNSLEPETVILLKAFLEETRYSVVNKDDPAFREEGRPINIELQDSAKKCRNTPAQCALSPIIRAISKDPQRVNIPLIRTFDDELDKEIYKNAYKAISKDDFTYTSRALAAFAMEEDIRIAVQLQLAENYTFLEAVYGSGLPSLGTLKYKFCPSNKTQRILTSSGHGPDKHMVYENVQVKINERSVIKCNILLENLYTAITSSNQIPARAKTHDEKKQELRQLAIEISNLRSKFAEQHRTALIDLLLDTQRRNEGLDKEVPERRFTGEYRQDALAEFLKENGLDKEYQEDLSKIANKFPISRYLLADEDAAEEFFGNPKFDDNAAKGFPTRYTKGIEVEQKMAFTENSVLVMEPLSTPGLSQRFTYKIIGTLPTEYKYFDFDSKYKKLNSIISEKAIENLDGHGSLISDYTSLLKFNTGSFEYDEHYDDTIERISELVSENPITATSVFMISKSRTQAYADLLYSINSGLRDIREHRETIESIQSALKIITAVAGALWLVGGIVGWCLKGISAGATVVFSAIRVTSFFSTLVFAATPPLLTGIGIYQKTDIASQKDAAILSPELNTLLVNHLTEKERSLTNEIYWEAAFSVLSPVIAVQLVKELKAVQSAVKNKDLFKAYLFTGNNVGGKIINNAKYADELKTLRAGLKEGELDRLVIYLSNSAGDAKTIEILENSKELSRVLKIIQKNYPGLLSEPISAKNLKNFKKLYNSEIYSMESSSIFGGAAEQVKAKPTKEAPKDKTGSKKVANSDKAVSPEKTTPPDKTAKTKTPEKTASSKIKEETPQELVPSGKNIALEGISSSFMSAEEKFNSIKNMSVEDYLLLAQKELAGLKGEKLAGIDPALLGASGKSITEIEIMGKPYLLKNIKPNSPGVGSVINEIRCADWYHYNGLGPKTYLLENQIPRKFLPGSKKQYSLLMEKVDGVNVKDIVLNPNDVERWFPGRGLAVKNQIEVSLGQSFETVEEAYVAFAKAVFRDEGLMQEISKGRELVRTSFSLTDDVQFMLQPRTGTKPGKFNFIDSGMNTFAKNYGEQSSSSIREFKYIMDIFERIGKVTDPKDIHKIWVDVPGADPFEIMITR